MPKLSPYFARNSLKRLGLPDAVRQHAERLLDLAGDDHSIQVARIHATMFPVSTPASANAGLNRLLRTINDAAQAQGLALRAEITPDKKAGPAKRFVWFDGPLPAPAPAYTGELNAIAPGQLVTDQRGLPQEFLPVIVLITFNPHETAAVIAQFHPQALPPTETRHGMTYNRLGVHGGMQVIQRVSGQGEGEAQTQAGRSGEGTSGAERRRHWALPDSAMILVTMPASSSKNVFESSDHEPKSSATVSRFSMVGNGSDGSFAPSTSPYATPSTPSSGRKPLRANWSWPVALSTKSSQSPALGSASISTAPGFSIRIVVSGTT